MTYYSENLTPSGWVSQLTSTRAGTTPHTETKQC